MTALGPLCVLLLPASAGAQVLMPCVSKSGTSYREPQTLEKLVECQSKAMAAFVRDYEKKHEQDEPPDSLMDRLEGRQRAEVREYLRRHPRRAHVDIKSPETQEARAEQEDEWRNGITPAIAMQITDNITRQQGGVSPDMSRLLDALRKDGPNLTDETVALLKQVARKAKREGLDLKASPDVEKLLLESADIP